MNYTEFVNAVKEKLTQELNGVVRVNVYTTKKNNATERTGLILETPGVNISADNLSGRIHLNYMKKGNRWIGSLKIWWNYMKKSDRKNMGLREELSSEGVK